MRMINDKNYESVFQVVKDMPRILLASDFPDVVLMNTLCIHSLKVGRPRCVLIKEMGDACNVIGMKQNLLEISVCFELLSE